MDTILPPDPDRPSAQVSTKPRELQADLRRGRERVEQSTRMLSIVRDIQAASGGSVTLTFFDDKRQSLIEIDQQYQRQRARNPRAALAVRNARTLGLLTNRLGYQPLRSIDETFLSEYLEPALNENPVLRSVMPALQDGGDEGVPAGLDILEVDDEGEADLLDVAPLVTALAQSEGADTVELPAGSEERTVDRSSVIDAVTDVIQSAIEEARLDARRGDRLQNPRQLLVEADAKLRRALAQYESVSTDVGFDAEAFNVEFDRIARRIDAFREQL